MLDEAGDGAAKVRVIAADGTVEDTRELAEDALAEAIDSLRS